MNRNTLVHATIGAAITVVLSFVGISPLFGGAVAGFLERSDARDGAVLGVLSGVVALVPGGLLVLPVLLWLGYNAVSVAVVTIALGIALYAVSMSVIGGVVGGYLGDVSASRSRARSDPEKRRRENVIEKLRERYAAGDIDEHEYERRVEFLLEPGDRTDGEAGRTTSRAGRNRSTGEGG